jgi:hypothetical protein
VGPTQIGTHCVPIWKVLEKSPHIPQITLIEAFTKFGGEGFR